MIAWRFQKRTKEKWKGEKQHRKKKEKNEENVKKKKKRKQCFWRNLWSKCEQGATPSHQKKIADTMYINILTHSFTHTCTHAIVYNIFEKNVYYSGLYIFSTFSSCYLLV